MGFWTTGYMEFHEDAGLGDVYRPELTVYRCQHCAAYYDAMDELLRHRFEAHPYVRPLLFVRGIELGATPFRVTRAVAAADFVVERSNKARVNGKAILSAALPALLAEFSNDKVEVKLSNDGAHAAFVLIFRVASEEHLVGVESAFLQFARERVLTIASVEGFIEACRKFDTAAAYCDGVCQYLYGVLAKERSADSSLPYEEYLDRFNRAADVLRDYDRPLARIVRGLVAFHFNHFRDAAISAPPGRLHYAARRFVSMLEVGTWEAEAPIRTTAPEDLLTDHETLRILRWAALPFAELGNELDSISALANGEVPEFDRMKLRMLLAEVSAAAGKSSEARMAARALVGNPKTASWAEAILGRLAGQGSME